MEDLIYNSSLGRINGIILNHKVKENAERFIRQYQLETSKGYWSNVSKKSWQVWKKDETEAGSIYRKTMENLEYKKNNLHRYVQTILNVVLLCFSKLKKR